MEKPKNITLAVNLSWASIAIGFISLFFNPAAAAGLGSLIPSVIAFALVAFLVIKLSAGRNWARITLLVLFVLGMLMEVFALSTIFQISALLGILSLAQAALQAYVLYLVFTKPGSDWFTQNKAAA
jgi:hypothetical protein